MREGLSLVIGTLVLGSAALAASSPSESSFANVYPGLSISKSRPSLPVRDASVFALPGHQLFRTIEGFKKRAYDITPNQHADLENLHEIGAPSCARRKSLDRVGLTSRLGRADRATTRADLLGLLGATGHDRLACSATCLTACLTTCGCSPLCSRHGRSLCLSPHVSSIETILLLIAGVLLLSRARCRQVSRAITQ